MIARTLTACSLAALATIGAIAGCSSPGPPEIPDRKYIGPPGEAAADCQPPYRMFAQDPFVIADLDTGISCTAFVEQDECIVAIFRDCTDHEATPPRSWQGAVSEGTSDMLMHLRLFRTRETNGSIMPRSPISCEGVLEQPEGEPTWLKLSCRTSGGAVTPPHRGFYLEKVPKAGEPSVPAIGTVGTPIIVAPVDPPTEDYVADFAVLAAARELWAVVDAGPGNPASGLYTGHIGDQRLIKQDAVTAETPTLLRISGDERYALIGDGTALRRVDTSTKGELTAGGPQEKILDIAVLSEGALVATEVRPRPMPAFRLSLRAFADLHVIKSATLAGDLGSVVLTPGAAEGIAVLTYSGETHVDILTAELRVARTLELNDVPGTAAYVPDLDLFTYGLGSPSRFATIVLATGERWEMHPPEAADVRSLMYDAAASRMLVGTRGGLLTAIDLLGKRPLLQSRLSFDRTVSALRRDPMTGTIYALRGASGFIDPIAPPPPSQ